MASAEIKMPIWNRKKPSVTPHSFAKGDAAGFWRWFKTNEASVARGLASAVKGEADGHEAGAALAAALTRYHKGLVFEIGVRPEERLDFVISADGIIERFSAVIALKKAAPESRLFEFTAFRQPHEGMVLEMHGARFSAETARFALADSPGHKGKFDIDVYIDPQSLDLEQSTQAAFILLDATIGEYDMETLIGHIEVMDIGEAAEGETLPLSSLPAKLSESARSGTRH
jgi:hypothetical protein